MSIPRNSRGQFMPLTAMVILISVVMLIAAVNIYQVAKAKLVAQNIADAAALAIAAMQAKEINVVVDRNEWLNHMYPDNAPPNQYQLPNLSKANNWKVPSGSASDEGQQYAQLVASINQAQQMFQDAYSRFIGANPDAASQGSGPASLAEILSEIKGINDPTVQLLVFNNDNGADTAKGTSQSMTQNSNASASGGGAFQNIYIQGNMAPVQFDTVPITLNTSNGPKTLAQILGMPSSTQVGWMRPNWDPPSTVGGGLTVNLPNGEKRTTIGAGAICIKAVPMMMPFLHKVSVTARADAYVDQTTGLSRDTRDPDQPPTTPFRPTYFVRLGLPK